jgi:hypothetical protein
VLTFVVLVQRRLSSSGSVDVSAEPLADPDTADDPSDNVAGVTTEGSLFRSEFED